MGKSSSSGTGYGSGSSGGAAGYAGGAGKGYGSSSGGYNLALKYNGRNLSLYLSDGASSGKAGMDRNSESQLKGLLNRLYGKRPYMDRLEWKAEPLQRLMSKCPSCGHPLGGQSYSLN